MSNINITMLTTKDYNSFTISGTNHTFIGAKLANKCLPGDGVEWDTQRNVCNLVSRGNHHYIVGTLELTNKSKYGLTNRQLPMYLFTPYDKCYPHFIVGSSERDLSRNIIALISFGEWSHSSTFPRGNIQQVLGRSGDYEAEYSALVWQACPWKYDKKKEYIPMLKDTCTRTHITGKTFHIDPPGCRDVDDVFTFEEVEHGWRATITISDVAAYVQPGSEVDKLASQIGQTLYDNEGGVIRPMLPPSYSEEACSLLPGKERHGVSMSFIWNSKEQIITDIKWFASILTVENSYTYDEFQHSNSSYKQPLIQIASYLADRNITDSHEWVEQMMLFYNREAGRLLKKYKQGLLRRHSQPDMEKLDNYKRSGIPELEKLAYSSAEYCLASEEETVHYGLETDAYAHASSPIRRYADLINQRVLKEIIKCEDSVYILAVDYMDMNRRGKATKRFSRDLDFLRAITTGETRFTAIIMEKKIKDGKMKIKLYVQKWKRMVSTWYHYLMDDIVPNQPKDVVPNQPKDVVPNQPKDVVLSRDETREIDVTLYREVEMECAFMPNGRNWKERVVLNILV